MDDTTAEPSLVLWKRHDLPGHEACRLVAQTYGWEISGTALFDAGLVVDYGEIWSREGKP